LAYVVRFSPRSLDEIEEYRQYILDHSHDNVAANAWVSAIFEAASTLKHFPKRCPHIPEQARFDLELFQLLYASHRLIFHVDGDLVEILRVYPSAARPLRSLRQRPKHGDLP
jgi:plasmid stabilization system protein ParE